MPRRIDSNGKPEPLDPEVIEKFLTVGIPYRLAMLRLAEDVSPTQSTIDSAFIEAAIVSGRLLMQFLGLGIERRGGLKLVQRHDYHMADGHTDEVKIPDLGAASWILHRSTALPKRHWLSFTTERLKLLRI